MAVSISPETVDRRRCQNCSGHVSTTFRRIYGDDDRNAHRCPSCDSWRRLDAGSARGDDVDILDPAENPERGGGRWSA